MIFECVISILDHPPYTEWISSTSIYRLSVKLVQRRPTIQGLINTSTVSCKHAICRKSRVSLHIYYIIDNMDCSHLQFIPDVFQPLMSWLIFSFVPNSLNSITHAPPIYIIHLHFLHPHPKPNKIKDKTILTSISRVSFSLFSLFLSLPV